MREATQHDIPAVRVLLREYAAWLADPEWLGVDLGFQNFEEELRDLPGCYAPPHGGLLVAEVAGVLDGCVGFRRLDLGVCEMKRLYVRPARRGSGLGRRLVSAILAAARRAGYRTMRLDTLPVMQAAQTLYRSLGFCEIQPYYDSPVPGTVYMERDLTHR
ncbi:MAG: GNAT family N-acetyltransferase [Deltaproteobacteria bacterium]|nr:GNAT family N-acetyltransferase [Deltaproteobacteria bacterium]